jgi:hypothetical protein
LVWPAAFLRVKVTGQNPATRDGDTNSTYNNEQEYRDIDINVTILEPYNY